jgi:hypothetical protein
VHLLVAWHSRDFRDERRFFRLLSIPKLGNKLGTIGVENRAKTGKTGNYKAKRINRIANVMLSAKPLFSGSSPLGASRKILQRLQFTNPPG